MRSGDLIRGAGDEREHDEMQRDKYGSAHHGKAPLTL
jgi:hypothetical protein